MLSFQRGAYISSFSNCFVDTIASHDVFWATGSYHQEEGSQVHAFQYLIILPIIPLAGKRPSMEDAHVVHIDMHEAINETLVPLEGGPHLC